ncbi:hypothetical protein, partial [Micromonospora sp. NPDC050200]|uniref:hypothetical protein n=1 Tax=Micromonospora sp. NPDC050200 TaxID=3155664 RepID=UPI00340C6985
AAYDTFLTDNYMERWEVSDQEARQHLTDAAKGSHDAPDPDGTVTGDASWPGRTPAAGATGPGRGPDGTDRGRGAERDRRGR